MLVDATLYVFGRCVISTYSTHVVHSTIIWQVLTYALCTRYLRTTTTITTVYIGINWTHHITNIQIAGKPSRRNHSTNDGIVKHRFVFDIGTTKSNKKIEKYEKCTNNA